MSIPISSARSLEPLLDGAEFVTANLFPHRVNNAFIASVPGHVILDEALAEMKPREFFGFDRWAAGPSFFNSIVERHMELGSECGAAPFASRR